MKKNNPAVWFEIYVQNLDEMNHPVACGDTPP